MWPELPTRLAYLVCIDLISKLRLKPDDLLSRGSGLIHQAVCTAAAADQVSVGIQLREREAGIEGVMGPVEDMYALLLRYEVRVPKDETDLVSDMRYSWKKLRRMASDVSDHLARLQARHKTIPASTLVMRMLQVDLPPCGCHCICRSLCHCIHAPLLTGSPAFVAVWE